MITFKGLQKFSLIDYPKKISAIAFLPYCNFRCSYCYNSSLVLKPETLPDTTEEEVLSFLETRKGKLDALVITGGEPTLNKDIIPFIKKVKNLNFLVKIDTNGTNPELLKELIKIVDFIAMDIKAPLEKYENITNTKVDVKNIEQSINLIKNSKIDYEFRTTLLPALLSKEDIMKIADLLKNSKKYVLQQFKPLKGLINENFKKEKNYSIEDLNELKDKIKSDFKEVEIRI